MEGNGIAGWSLLEGNVQSGSVCSLGLPGEGEVGGGEVGVVVQGKEMEHPLEPRIRTTSITAVRIHLRSFSILSLLYHLARKILAAAMNQSDLIYRGVVY